jgi:AcrR family transcriptional regulator
VTAPTVPALAATPKPRDRREALIDAVFRCVVRHGLSGATVSAIAAEAGVSRGIIHYHFRDKLALYEAAFERVVEGFQEALQRHPRDAAQPPEEQLRQLVLLGLPVTRTSRERSRFWLEFLAARFLEPGLKELHDRHAERWRGFVRERLAAMQADGSLSPAVDTAALAMAIVAFSDGLGTYMVDGSRELEPLAEAAAGIFSQRMAG